jgi:hypothetical protein
MKRKERKFEVLSTFVKKRNEVIEIIVIKNELNIKITTKLLMKNEMNDE